MKEEELINYCKKNLGINIAHYSGKNSAECVIFVGDYHFSVGRENGHFYLNFPRKNVYLHDGDYVIRTKERFLYVSNYELQKMINLCHHVETPNGNHFEVIKCPSADDFLQTDLLHSLLDYMGLRFTPLMGKGQCRFVDLKSRKKFELKPNDLFIIKPDGYSIVKEEDIPMSPLEEDSFIEECKIWLDFDDEDLNCISMHGMTCGEYQAVLEDIEEEEKNRLMRIKESHEAIWDIIDEF